MDSGPRDTTMFTLPIAVPTGVLESVTLMVKLDVPTTVGVPVMTPVGDSLSPVGRVPEAKLKIYGAVPPVAVIVPKYGVARVAADTPLITTVNPPPPPVPAIVKLNDPVPLFCGTEMSVTLTVRFAVPAAVGSPLIVQPVSVRPAGSVPAVILQRYGAVPPVTPMVPR